MKLLLDIHVWVWSQETPEALGARTRLALEDPATAILVSPVSSLEVARLVWGGRLVVVGRIQTWVEEALAALGAQTEALTHQIATDAYQLPGQFHRDPADRLLVATARTVDATLVTADDRILKYPQVLSLDARS